MAKGRREGSREEVASSSTEGESAVNAATRAALIVAAIEGSSSKEEGEVIDLQLQRACNSANAVAEGVVIESG